MSNFSPAELEQLMREILQAQSRSTLATLGSFRPNLRLAIGVLPPRQLPRTDSDAGGDTATPGFVKFAPDGGTVAFTAVQGSDSRLLASTNLAAHIAAADPHPQYALESEALYLGMRDTDLAPAGVTDGTFYFLRRAASDTRGYLTALSGMPFGWLSTTSSPTLRVIDNETLFTV